MNVELEDKKMVKGGQHFAMGSAPNEDMRQPGKPNGYSCTNHAESKAINLMRENWTRKMQNLI